MIRIPNKPLSAAVIVSTYNQPHHLKRCLQALKHQTWSGFEVLVADDGSGDPTRSVIEQVRATAPYPLHHIWHADRGFRKTRILNLAVHNTRAEYLIFIDGDCLAQPTFVAEHLRAAEPRCYLNGSIIRLNHTVSKCIDRQRIDDGDVFSSRWLRRHGHPLDRRLLKLSAPYTLRRWANRISRTRLYWLGSNSSCFRIDAEAVNGFDNRFTYGFEDGDFGKRLENSGIRANSVRYTATLLHLHHDRPYTNPDEQERNRKLMTVRGRDGRVRAPDGLAQVRAERDQEPAAISADFDSR